MASATDTSADSVGSKQVEYRCNHMMKEYGERKRARVPVP